MANLMAKLMVKLKASPKPMVNLEMEKKHSNQSPSPSSNSPQTSSPEASSPDSDILSSESKSESEIHSAQAHHSEAVQLLLPLRLLNLLVVVVVVVVVVKAAWHLGIFLIIFDFGSRVKFVDLFSYYYLINTSIKQGNEEEKKRKRGFLDLMFKRYRK